MATAWEGDWEKEGKSIAELLDETFRHVQELIRSEMRLAKAELSEEGRRAAKAAAVLGAGAVLGFYMLGFGLLTVVYALTTALPPWLSSLIVSIVAGMFAAALILSGAQRLKKIHPTPERAIESTKETVRWVKSQLK
jgi:uncharacterized membrane protein YqjE